MKKVVTTTDGKIENEYFGKASPCNMCNLKKSKDSFMKKWFIISFFKTAVKNQYYDTNHRFKDVLISGIYNVFKVFHNLNTVRIGKKPMIAMNNKDIYVRYVILLSMKLYFIKYVNNYPLIKI